MPAPTSTAELIDLVRKSGLYEGNTFDNRLENLPKLPEQPVSTATFLVRHGLITKFQAKLLLMGKYRGFRIGPYTIKEQIGQGGMGSVYLAEHITLRRKVALKVLTPGAEADQKVAVERFMREARSAAALDHPNIVRLHDVGQFGTSHYIVMEYVEGETLDKLAQKGRTIPCGKAVEYIAQAAAGLQHAYEKGFVHRDIKPANLILSLDGTIKILDMGLARSSDERDKLTANIDIGAIVGTADYISPEQAVNDPKIDIRADIYSLGATFYSIVTGRPPFSGNTTQKLVQHQIKDAPSLTRMDKTLPKELAEVISKMMAKKKEQRFRTPADVIGALTPWLPNSGKVVAGLTQTEAGAAGLDTMDQIVASSTKSLTKSLRRAIRGKYAKYYLGGGIAAGVLILITALGYAFFGGGTPKSEDTSRKQQSPVNPVVNPTTPNDKTATVSVPNSTRKAPRATITETVYRLDFTQLPKFRNRIKEGILLEGEKAILPAGVAAYAQGVGVESAFASVDADKGTAFVMTHLSNASGTQLACELEKPVANGGAGIALKPGQDYKLRIECRTEGVARVGVGIHTIVGFKPAAEFTLVSVTKGDWQVIEIPFSRTDAGALRFVVANQGRDAVNSLWLRSIEIRTTANDYKSEGSDKVANPGVATGNAQIAMYTFSPAAIPEFQFSVRGFDVTSGQKPDLPPILSLHCWKPGSTGEFRCEKIDGRQSIRLASRNEPCSAQLRIDVESEGGATLQEGKEYEFRVTYQTRGNQIAKLTLMTSKFDYLSGAEMPASEGRWQTVSIKGRREKLPLCCAINADAPSDDGFITVAAVEVIDVDAAKNAVKPHYSLNFEGMIPGTKQILKSTPRDNRFEIGAQMLPKEFMLNQFDMNSSGEYSLSAINGTMALGLRLLEGTHGTQANIAVEGDQRLPPGQTVVARITYQNLGEGTGSTAFELSKAPYTKMASAKLPPTGPKWVTVEFPFDRPDDNERYTLIINPGNTIHSDRNKATIWIKSIDIVPLGGAASSNTETTLPVDPNTIIYDLKVADWKPFRFTSEGSKVTSGTKPNFPNGVSLHCWKPKSVAQFVGADSGDGLTVGLTNLNDETSSQFLAQLEYDLDVKLVTGKQYAVRVDYRTVNEGAGNVTLQSEEYSVVQTTPLDATAGAWQTKDALFTRREGKPIRIAINSTGIGEGNTLGIRRLTVFEVP